MDKVERIKQIMAENNYRSVPIVDMDYDRQTVVGDDGRTYTECDANVWYEQYNDNTNIAYVNTGKHAGGIVIRPAFIYIDRAWYNTISGRPAPEIIVFPKRTDEGKGGHAF